MPNAAAHFDDDFDVAPERKKVPRRSSKPAKSKRKKKSKSRFGVGVGFPVNVDMQRVARYGAIGMSATVAVGILVNALMMQTGHHPAPLFGKSIVLGESAVKAPFVPATANKKVEPAPAPVERPHIDAPIAYDADATPTPDDAIGRLLDGRPAAAERSNTKTVLGVQRALTKLGLAVKPTGTFGPQTKKAIEHFEKDHHLPVRGEMSRRTVKLLASTSGMKIDY